MTRPVHELAIEVPPEAVDANDHVNNVVYLEWLQRVAIDHAETVGGDEIARRHGGIWVVREHRIRYLDPAFAGDRLTLRTWVESLRRVRCLRRTEILRGETRVAEGWTEWAFLDATTTRPKAIPPELAERFGFPGSA